MRTELFKHLDFVLVEEVLLSYLTFSSFLKIKDHSRQKLSINVRCKIDGKKHLSRNVYIYTNQILIDLNAKSSLNFLRNSGISEISDFYNNSLVDRTKQNPITSTLFYAVAPFNPKTIARTKNKIINPDNTINGIIQTFGGQFFRFHNNEDISLDDYPFQIFAWFSPYRDFIINSDQFNLITTIELDATFEALDTYVICVPHLIYRNTGIPIGILVSLSESASLYSIFFES